jgi:hypothetical protein
MVSTAKSEVFCSYKSTSICSIPLFDEIWCQTGRIWLVNNIVAAVRFRSSCEQIDPGCEFYYSQKSYRVTQQCSRLGMLANKIHIAHATVLFESVFFSLQMSFQFCAVF